MTANGRHVLFASKKGHLASFDQLDKRLHAEFYVKANSSMSGGAQFGGGGGEIIKDVQWLHNEMFYAVAQRNYVYIYDHTGMEVHCLRKHLEVNCMQFLRHHFLLTTVGNEGILRYHDTSVGNLVTEIKTRMGPCAVMALNP